jgi:hypothetical protein
MACIFRGPASTITCRLMALPALLFCALPGAMAQLYEQPVLVVDPGMHTSIIHSVGADASGRFAVTGSYDKTVRVGRWRMGSCCRQSICRLDLAMLARHTRSL